MCCTIITIIPLIVMYVCMLYYFKCIIATQGCFTHDWYNCEVEFQVVTHDIITCAVIIG